MANKSDQMFKIENKIDEIESILVTIRSEADDMDDLLNEKDEKISDLEDKVEDLEKEVERLTEKLNETE